MSLLVDVACRLKALFCIAVSFIQLIGFPFNRQIGLESCVQRRCPLFGPTLLLVRPGKKPALVAGFAKVSAASRLNGCTRCVAQMANRRGLSFLYRDHVRPHCLPGILSRSPFCCARVDAHSLLCCARAAARSPRPGARRGRIHRLH